MSLPLGRSLLSLPNQQVSCGLMCKLERHQTGAGIEFNRNTTLIVPTFPI
jgi:hypothetical protein